MVTLLISLTGCSQSATEQIESSNIWQITNTKELAIEGVSPELIQNRDGEFLLFTTSPAQQRVFKSTDGNNFVPESLNLPMGADYSVIEKNNGTYLLYFVGFEMQPPLPNQQQGQVQKPPMGQKKVFVSTSEDLKTFSEPIFTGIEQPDETPAWGVPDTYLDLQGNVKMMWVEILEGENTESLITATSQDGINFTRDEGVALTGGYVDPYMLQVADNDWILLLSTTPDQRRLPQKLYVAYSADGLTWQVDKNPLLQDKNINYLDPAAVKTAENTWQIIYSKADLDKAISGPHVYESGVLQLSR